MKKLLLLFLLFTLRVGAQSLGFSIETNGWIANLYVNGMGTNGSYTFGFDTNNTPTANAGIYFLVTSQGYDDVGAPTTLTRKVYGQFAARKVYPLEAEKDESLVTQGVKLRIILDEVIFQGDSNIVAFTKAGFYTQGGTNSTAMSATTVTNLSTEAYPKTLAKWTWPGFQNVRTASWTNRAFAVQKFAQGGRPVRAVKFWVTDKNGTTVTNWQTQMKLDRTWGDAVPFPEYLATFNTNSFVGETLLTMNFAAFPWIGDTNSVYDSSKVTSFTQPTPRAVTLTNAIYQPTWAIIDPVNGVDASGHAANLTSYTASTNIARFKTMSAAGTAIQGTNGASYGRTNIGAGIFMLADTATNTTLGATVTLTGNQDIAYEVMPYPGSDAYAGRIQNLNDNRFKDDSDMRIDRGLVYDTAQSTFISRHRHYWADECVILNATGAAYWDNASVAMNVYFTRCIVSNLTQGLRGPSTHNAQLALTRGNTVKGNLNNTTMEARAMFGNRNIVGSRTNYTVTDQIAGSAGDTDHTIVAYNTFYNMDKLASVISIGSDFGLSEGAAFLNNVIETAINDSATISIQFCTSPTLQYTNVLIWNNHLLGCKTFLAYQDEGTNWMARHGFSFDNNIVEDMNVKTDWFVGSGGPSGNRWGNWETFFGVSQSGNAYLETTSAGGNDIAHGIGAPGSFIPEFPGISSWGTTTTTTSSTNYVKFWNRQCNDGTTADMPGFGDYRLHSSSPLWRRNPSYRWRLPYDIYGSARSANDGPGAFTTGNPRKLGL